MTEFNLMLNLVLLVMLIILVAVKKLFSRMQTLVLHPQAYFHGRMLDLVMSVLN